MTQHTINIPDELHADTADLVVRFAEALAAKLRAAEVKYHRTNGWTETYWQSECAQSLLDHVAKGDPLDVAAYAAFMWHHKWPTSLRVSAHYYP